MSNRNWLEKLRLELDRKRIPRRFHQRLMEELQDHLQELKEEGTDMSTTCMEALEERMGQPAELATIANSEYGRLGFWRRHPWATFVLLPIPTILLMAHLFALAMLGLAWLTGTYGDLDSQNGTRPIPFWALLWIQTLHEGMRFVPFAAATLIYCWLGRKLDLKARWTVIACGLITICAFAFHSTLQMPTPGEKGSLMFGFGIGLGSLPRVGQLWQLAVPLTIAGFMAWRMRRQSTPILVD